VNSENDVSVSGLGFVHPDLAELSSSIRASFQLVQGPMVHHFSVSSPRNALESSHSAAIGDQSA
jgi:hypothetical protein